MVTKKLPKNPRNMDPNKIYCEICRKPFSDVGKANRHGKDKHGKRTN